MNLSFRGRLAHIGEEVRTLADSDPTHTPALNEEALRTIIEADGDVDLLESSFSPIQEGDGTTQPNPIALRWAIEAQLRALEEIGGHPYAVSLDLGHRGQETLLDNLQALSRCAQAWSDKLDEAMRPIHYNWEREDWKENPIPDIMKDNNLSAEDVADWLENYHARLYYAPHLLTKFALRFRHYFEPNAEKLRQVARERLLDKDFPSRLAQSVDSFSEDEQLQLIQALGDGTLSTTEFQKIAEQAYFECIEHGYFYRADQLNKALGMELSTKGEMVQKGILTRLTATGFASGPGAPEEFTEFLKIVETSAKFIPAQEIVPALGDFFTKFIRHAIAETHDNKGVGSHAVDFALQVANTSYAIFKTMPKSCCQAFEETARLAIETELNRCQEKPKSAHSLIDFGQIVFHEHLKSAKIEEVYRQALKTTAPMLLFQATDFERPIELLDFAAFMDEGAISREDIKECLRTLRFMKGKNEWEQQLVDPVLARAATLRPLLREEWDTWDEILCESPSGPRFGHVNLEALLRNTRAIQILGPCRQDIMAEVHAAVPPITWSAEEVSKSIYNAMMRYALKSGEENIALLDTYSRTICEAISKASGIEIDPRPIDAEQLSRARQT